MALIMGIDTGGTFTDGVIVDPADRRVLCKSKVFTEPSDLMRSIGACIESLTAAEVEKVALVCLSTTLATNAIVEGRKGRVGLLLIGGEPEGRLPADLCVRLRGRLDIKGAEKERLDREEILQAIESLKHRVDAMAISGYASVRNPDHELQVKQLIRDRTALPGVCAHELTSELGYYDRTVTVALNAGLIPVISELIHAVKNVLQNRKINASIMIVKGDGSLMQESFALDRPIDTILSGPAASVIGGIFLTDQKEALVIDMGGTTTDIARIAGGGVKIRKSGARVGGWSTRTQAADICTFGIGGNSRLYFSARGELRIGPQRVQSLCAAGSRYPWLSRELEEVRRLEELRHLEKRNAWMQAEEGERFHEPEEQETDCFSLGVRWEKEDLNDLEKQIVESLKDGPHSLFFLVRMLEKEPEELGLTHLVRKGILDRIAVTPTDLLHVSGKYNMWNAAIARTALEIVAERRSTSVAELLETAERAMTDRLCAACRESVDGFEKGNTDFFLRTPMVAIGAPVRAWMPAVGDKLYTKLIIPEHSEVANAIGAAVGQVMESAEALIRPRKEPEGFLLHAPWEYRYFETLEEAVAYTVPAIRRYVEDLARGAGSDAVELVESHEHIFAEIDTGGRKTYIETRVRAAAIGSPKWKTF